MSKSAAEVLVGEQFDQFHIMQLANASGQQSYASVLTVTKVVRCDDLSVLDTPPELLPKDDQCDHTRLHAKLVLYERSVG